jgi:hypothetical protein
MLTMAIAANKKKIALTGNSLRPNEIQDEMFGYIR